MNSLCRPPGGSHRARPFMLLRMGIGLAALALGRGAAPAETFHWTGTGGTNWFDAANWTGESGQPGVPGDGDSATIGAGAVLLTNSTASLAALVVDGGTLTCSNWPTRINAVTVTLNGGRLTLPPAFRETGTSNRVWIVCSNLTVASGGTIDVSGKGFAGGDWNTSGHGPGKGAGSATTSRAGGGGYGGCGGYGHRLTMGWYLSGGLPYGTASDAAQPGSGGGGPGYQASNYGGAGGGAVRIDAAGDVMCDGTIMANGTAGSQYGGGGSGGGISIACARFGGKGALLANGGKPGTDGGGNVWRSRRRRAHRRGHGAHHHGTRAVAVGSPEPPFCGDASGLSGCHERRPGQCRP